MLVRMRRVDVVAPRSQAPQLLRALHRAGVLHLVPFDAPPGVDPAVFRAEAASGEETALAQRLGWLSELAGWLGPAAPPIELSAELWTLDDTALTDAATAMEPVRDAAGTLAAELASVEGELARLARHRELISALEGVVGRLPALPGYGLIAVVVPVRYRAVLDMLQTELESLTGGRCGLITAELAGERVTAVLVYPGRLTAEVHAMLSGRELDELALPESLTGVPFAELVPHLLDQERALRQRSEVLRQQLASLAARHAPRVAALQLVLRDRIAEADALRHTGASDHLVVVSGWIPARRLPALRALLDREIGSTAIVTERALEESDLEHAPVALDNGRLIRPFQSLAAFVSLPRYGSLDPTPFLAITFPVFVGLMVGDAGYGLLMLGLLLWARRRWRDRPLMGIVWPIAGLAAGATILFGILFGEWFGDAGHSLLGIGPLWLDRRQAVLPMLELTVAIGVAQIGLGLALGIVNAALLGHRKALIARSAQLASMAAVLVTLAWLARLLPPAAGFTAVAVLCGGLIVLVISHGMEGPIELLGTVGNVLSYARLMAIGLASVMLAAVANHLGAMTENLLLGLLVAGALHTLNIVMGFFDSSVQGLRLHYVEFFSKFVEPGQVRYVPFVSGLDTLARGRGLRTMGGP